jgi:two-component system chemotaxis sensor kinase CheA
MSESELEVLSARDLEDLIFAPGFSTATQITDVSGRGVGLDVVRANVEKLRGTVEVESRAGQGCIFRLSMPATLATTRVLLVRCQRHTYAIPIAAVQSVLQFVPDNKFSFQGREAIAHDGRPVPLARLSFLLGISAESEARQNEAGSPCILLEESGEPLALLVDALLDEQEIVLKPLDAPLRHSRLVGGTTILDSGEVCLMLNTQNLVKSALARVAPPSNFDFAHALGAASAQTPARPKMILLAEDSITTRTQEKRILEGAGYQVVTAVDGLDAWHKLGAGEFDAVVSDVEIPNLTGLELAERIRQDEKHRELPIILVTSLASEADRRRGVEVGANAYITKGAFDQKALLDVLKKLA